MSRAPDLLIITNAAVPRESAGQIDAYRILESTGELGRVAAVSSAEGVDGDPRGPVSRVLDAIGETRPDIVLILTPGAFPSRRDAFDRISEALKGVRLIYWEGDAWHRGKPISEQMRWWMQQAEAVFTVAGPPQATDFLASGATCVLHTAQTYCHIQFASAETEPPPEVTNGRVTMIGGNLMKIPGLGGLPGSPGRAELALRMRASRHDFRLHGLGWRWAGLKATPVAYSEQAETIRQGALSVNWDHFTYMSDYASDRLPISLISGRAHVTTRHPGMEWAPDESSGLFQCTTPAGIVELVGELLEDRDRLTRLGREAHRWSAHRVSHREAARHLMSMVVDTVRRPPADPWDKLPGPWVRN